ncbi:MAG TPA: response regulator transcription factor, partial [Synergistaceae bacterium]|nr:response regulator transcription factor [Synergistaceae bacterium]
ERDVVAGLELGADDYMKKPFSMNELMARVKALLRRTARKAPEEKHIVEGPLEWDVGAGMFRLEGEVLDLSPTEYRLLEELVLRRGKVVLREELLYKVWGYYGGDSRTVDVHISRLRRKVEEDPEHPLLVHTIRGRGYCLEWREKK